MISDKSALQNGVAFSARRLAGGLHWAQFTPSSALPGRATRPLAYLFGEKVPAGRYRILGPVVPLAVDRGATDTFEGQAAIFLKKSPPVQPPHYVAAEFICSQLAGQIRLPVPPAFIAELPGEEDRPAFSALAFNLSGGSTPAIVAAEAVAKEPDLCTGVIIFDCWIVNIDRHPKNISFQALRVPHKLNVFDHSHTLFFYPDNFTRYGDQLGITGDRGSRHCLLDALNTSQYVGKWADRIGRVSAEIVTEICRDAVELGLPEPLASETASFLIDRKDRLAGVISRHRHEFRGVADWPII